MADSLAESVKETLVGTTIEPQLSQQFKATFERHARRSDVEGGEPFMTEEDFVNAIAPKDEDYVRAPLLSYTLQPISRVDISP